MARIHSIAALGSLLRVRRRELRLTQAAAAKAAGLSRYTVNKLELGHLDDVNLKTVLALLRVLRLDLAVQEVGPTGLPILGDEPAP